MLPLGKTSSPQKHLKNKKIPQTFTHFLEGFVPSRNIKSLLRIKYYIHLIPPTFDSNIPVSKELFLNES